MLKYSSPFNLPLFNKRCHYKTKRKQCFFLHFIPHEWLFNVCIVIFFYSFVSHAFKTFFCFSNQFNPFLFSLFLQSFIWPLARPASQDETVTIELRTQTTKILLKTGLGSSSSSGSRGAISSSSKIIGRYVILMQGRII